MIEPLLEALAGTARYRSLGAADIAMLPNVGTAHAHALLWPDDPARRCVARIAHAHPGDPGARDRLMVQAGAFEHAAASGVTPRLRDAIAPTESLPGGVLIVYAIEGRAPRLPADMAAIADSLAALHGLPLPARGSLLPRQDNPFLATLSVVETNAMKFLDRAVPDIGARAEIAEELRAMRGMALAFARRPQPLVFALADTHPGNFLVDAAGKAWFVDLEKAHVGSAAIDLAHASLPTSTHWSADIDAELSTGEVRAFHRRYLDRIGNARADALKPWLTPMRRLTWLRTTLFFCRWRVETRAPRDRANPAQWSDAGLAPAMRAHVDRTIDRFLGRPEVERVRNLINADIL